jgi:ribosomal protein L12E/L44/L45/RPP1/RPP2
MNFHRRIVIATGEGKKMRSIKKFFSNFDDVMAAAAFAEAGEHETAKQMINEIDRKNERRDEERKEKQKIEKHEKANKDWPSLLASGDE